MALHIKFVKLPNILTEKEALERKIDFLIYFITTIRNFSPEKTEIILDSIKGEIVSTFDGFPKKANDITKLIMDDKFDRIILRVTGRLKIENDFKAYICLYNTKVFRNVYGDIEFDIYSKNEFGDLSDVIIKSEAIRECIYSFLKNLKDVKEIAINKLVVGSSPDAFFDIEDVVLIYYKNRAEFLANILKTLKMRSEEQVVGCTEPLKYIRPYNFDLIAKRVAELREFENVFNRSLKDTEIEIKTGASMILVAKQKDSFSKLYSRMVENIMIPSFQELPNEDQIVNTFRNSILKLKSLNNYGIVNPKKREPKSKS